MQISLATHGEPSANDPSDAILLTLTVAIFAATVLQAKAALSSARSDDCPEIQIKVSHVEPDLATKDGFAIT
jgi:hypothetical protein